MDTSKVILDEARPKLTAHLAARFKQKIGQNVNLQRAQGDRTAFLLRRAVPLGEVRELFRELFRQFALAKGENEEWTFGEWVFDRLLSGETEP